MRLGEKLSKKNPFYPINFYIYISVYEDPGN